MFTIVTVTYNAESCIQRTLNSVKNQDYPSVEHLIIDGKSKDNTLALCNKYKAEEQVHQITIISEPDKGLYDAMNKAIRLAKGKFILFLNAGDIFHSNTTLSDIVSQNIEDAGVLYGNTDIVDSQGKFLFKRRLRPPTTLTWKSFQKGMLVCHQAFFASTSLAKDCLYDYNYRFSADFDWCIRILKKAEEQNMPIINTQLIIADYLQEGMTTRNHKKSLIERLKIMVKYYGWVTTLFMHIYFVFRNFLTKTN